MNNSSESQPAYSLMQQVKRSFFSFRNGVIADTLRRAGAPYKIIFGLNLPQIKEIAATFAPDAGLASELWADNKCRESVLLAPMLYPAGEMTAEKALQWVDEAPTTEAIDILCMSLLRKCAFAPELAAELCAGTHENGVATEPDRHKAMRHYAALRLYFNILAPAHYENAMALAASLSSPEAQSWPVYVRSVAARLLDEVKWLTSPDDDSLD